MTPKKYVVFFFIAILHSFLSVIIAGYFFFIFPILILFWACVCLAIVAIDIMGKSRLWIGAFYSLGLAILSYILGAFMLDHLH